ncbi:alginate lyase family protein [Pedobacter arcticus]|uniref:alginate lyase family protein n=1 Tax=Pedobacter arcticus TaxID=752140 RepID=UPI000366128B|nr:alginate lyase family protein [Pedobacter arcticus]
MTKSTKLGFILLMAIAVSCLTLTQVTGRTAIKIHTSEAKPVYNYPIFSTSLEDFYNSIDYTISDLRHVKKAVDTKNYKQAGVELLKYYKKHKTLATDIFNISNRPQSKDARELSENLLQRTYFFQGVKHTFNEDFDWLYNPTGKNGVPLNPEWVVNTVRFRGLPILAGAYASTTDERFAIELVYLMRDFIEKFPVPLKEKNEDNIIPSEFDRLMYSKLSVSSRISTTVYSLFSIIDSPNLKSEDFVVIMQGIYNHLLRMEKYPYLTYHNMGVADAEVLQKVSVSLPEFKKTKEWANWALKRGLDQMNYVVYPDGVEKELCPRYHQGVMATFAKFMTVSEKSGTKPLPEFTEKLKAMAKFLVDFSRPDGTIPAFNEMVQTQDNKQTIRRQVNSIATLTGDQNILQWFGTDRAKGVKPDYTSVSFDWAGYYIMRSGWNKEDNYMAIKAGPYGLAHQHEDKLSFELFANGELFLVDPGFYTYNSKDIWRKYYLSSVAHNTLSPDGLSQYRYGNRHLYENKKPNDALWVSNDKYDFLSAVYNNGYADYKYLHIQNPEPLLEISHQRDILFIKPGIWLILDWIEPKDSNSHLYEALFQSQKQVQKVGSSLIVKGQNSDLHILPFAKGGVNLGTAVISAQNEPFRRGWIFDVTSQKNLPLPTGVVSQKIAGATAQAYFIIAGSKGSIAANVVESVVVNGGIGGKLTTIDGLKLSFIAQKASGNEISGTGLTTKGRLKLIVKGTKDIVEIK